MVARKGYKLTEVGEIPEDWEVTPWDNALSIVSGQVDPKASPYCDMILVAPDHIESESGRIMKKETAKDQNAISGKYIFLKGDIVYSKIRPHLRKVYCPDFDGICSADMYPLRARQGFIHTLLFYILLSDIFSRFAESISARSGIPKINRRELSAYIFALPPTDSEQTAIATALSDADALIDALEQCIAKKRHIKQGAMQELLTGKRRLPGFEGEWQGYKLTEVGEIPHDWEIISLDKAVSFLDGKRRPIKDADRQKMQGIFPYYGASGVIDYVNDYIFDDTLILLGEDGENILSRTTKLAFIVKGKVWINNHAHVLKSKEDIDDVYLVNFLESLNYEKYNSGTAQPKLNKQTCYTIQLALPSTKNEQAAIAAVLTAMDDEIAALEAKLSKAKQIKAGMMQELLTGRIRLV